jgi:hypothetical protein
LITSQAAKNNPSMVVAFAFVLVYAASPMKQLGLSHTRTKASNRDLATVAGRLIEEIVSSGTGDCRSAVSWASLHSPPHDAAIKQVILRNVAVSITRI